MLTGIPQFVDNAIRNLSNKLAIIPPCISPSPNGLGSKELRTDMCSTWQHGEELIVKGFQILLIVIDQGLVTFKGRVDVYTTNLSWLQNDGIITEV